MKHVQFIGFLHPVQFHQPLERRILKPGRAGRIESPLRTCVIENLERNPVLGPHLKRAFISDVFTLDAYGREFFI